MNCKYPFDLQALSISKSLLNAKSAVEKGQVNCQELRDSVVQAITKAGGKVDYAEVTIFAFNFFIEIQLVFFANKLHAV